MDANAELTTTQLNRLPSPVRRGLRLWDHLTEPRAAAGELERRRLRLAASISLSLLLIGVATLPVMLLYGNVVFDVSATLTAMGVLTAAYRLSRSGRAWLATLLLLLPLFAAPVLLAFASGNSLTLMYLCLSVLTASLITSLRLTLLIYGLALAAVVTFAVRFPGAPLTNLLDVFFLIGMIGALALLAAVIQRRDQQRIERQGEALAASEHKYRSLVDNTLVGVYQTNLEGRILFANPGLARLLDFASPAELVGASAAAHYRDPQVRARLLDALRQTKQVSDFETELVTRDGQVKTVLLSAWLDGETLSGMILDISERKRAEDALRESEERYRELFESAGDIVYTLDLDGNLTSLNVAGERSLGYPRAQILGQNVSAILSAEDDAYSLEMLQRKLGGESVTTYELNVRSRDGRIIPLEVSSRLLRRNGAPASILGIARDTTERKRAEAERERLLSILESSLNEIYLFASDTLKFQYVNAGAIRNLGYSLEQLKAMTPLDLKPEFTEASFRDMIGPLLRGGKDRHVFETVHRRADASEYPVEVHLQLVERAGERVFLAVILDITERRQAEESLRQSEQNLRTTLDTMLEGCQVIGFDWRYLYVNDAVARQGKQAKDALLGRTMMEVYPGIEQTELFASLRRCLAERRIHHLENEFTFLDGSKGWFELSIQPVPEGIFILSMDITERKRAEAEIRRMNAELEQRVAERTAALKAEIAERKQAEAALRKWAHLFEHAEWGIVVGSADGQRLEMMNPAFAGMHGWAVEELTGRPIVDVFAPEARADLPMHIRVAHERGHHTFESRHIRKDGATFPVLVDVTTVKDEAGQVLYRAVNVQDITERKRAEEEIQKAKEEAERANHAKSDFLSRMSHELRTPLNAILGFAQLMEMDDLTPRQAQGIKHTLRVGRHLLDLINEVLDLTRIESGRLALSPEPVLVRGVIQETFDLVQQAAAARGVALVFPESPHASAHVFADHQRLRQVLLNLVNNAVKYNREGGQVRVDCGLVTADLEPPSAIRHPPSAISQPPSVVRISVSDTGLGLAPSQLARLFVPFDRLGAEQTELEGTGLGLAVAKKLVEAMDGRIGVESTVGVGSTFWIELPLSESPLVRTGRLHALTEDVGRDETKRGTVLYVEDNLSNIELVEAILAHRPAVGLLTATQARPALTLARERQPDLILLDLNLPDMHGLEVLRRLQADEATRAIPVIVISADATRGQIQRLMETGARDYLTKPLDVRKFLEVVDEVMK